MVIFWGFLQVMVGVFFIWLGAFNIITSMVPRDVGMIFAEKHGAWMRENILNLPPATNREKE